MKYTKEIFDTLCRGGFICSNSVKPGVKRWYDAIEDAYREYREYYEGIGFILEEGNGYYYFSREDSRLELADKLERFMRWIDRLDFLKCFNSAFGPGFSFRRAAILERMASDLELKAKGMTLYREQLGLEDIVGKLLDELERIGFIEIENELDGIWKVTSAFNYIEALVDGLSVTEEAEDEVS